MLFKKIENRESAIDDTFHFLHQKPLKPRLSGADNHMLSIRADRLLEVLGELRHSRMPISRRFEALQQCRQLASRLRTSLDHQLVGLSLPAPARQISLSRRYADAYRLMSDCYRSIAEDVAAWGDGSLVDTKLLSQCCFWGIGCLGEYIVIRCECYLKSSPGVWLDVHKLYDIAALEGVEHMSLDAGSQGSSTVESAYKRVLLLGLSDPFQYPSRSLARLYRKLGEWAKSTCLTASSRPSTSCVFVVDPRLDRPATPAFSQTQVRAEFNQKWFVTQDLVARLKQEYDTDVNQSFEHFQRAESLASEAGSIDFLRRIIVRLGIHPMRTRARRKTARKCELVAGLKPVCIALNDFKSLNRSELQSSAGTRDGIRTPTDPCIKNGWEIEDESEDGLKLVCGSSGNYGASVDDLVAVRTDHTADWIVGTVHWAQTDESGNVALGVRLIRKSVRPVLMYRLLADGDKPADRSYSEALLFIDRSNGGFTRSLICRPSQYYPTGTYLFNLPGGQGRVIVEATNMLVSARSFVWFEAVKPQADTARKSLALIHPY